MMLTAAHDSAKPVAEDRASSQLLGSGGAPRSMAILRSVAKVRWGMQQDSSDPYLKAADEFFALSKTAETPFMRAYYERIALRYLSSEGGLKAIAQEKAGT
jgi:hypothetical protein